MIKNASISFLLIAVFVLFSVNLEKQRDIFVKSNFVEYTTPSKIIGPASLEFKGLTSDYLLFKFMTFVGEKAAEQSEISSKQWDNLIKTLDTITDLDPYFWDAYLFSEMFLAWGAGKIYEANRLLLKGTRYLPKKSRLYYYLGFNHFYFLKDNKKGSKYLMQASKLPGCSPYVANLAARLSVYAFEHRDGIMFLREMLKDTRNKTIRDRFKMRMITLEIMESLESKITVYYEKYGVYPASLEDLVIKGIIDNIPKDPYGGKFMILQNNRVYTTSNMLIKEMK
ncbi:hypothetical protein [Desulfobacula toluolica]|uniref:Conserved uncharacterized protein n=1 Tax=Desulfobacula toluolica (strain DSM 7467 / Tol2) TaxID=651182 RepID=K0NK60_DESTT|nr:hypothetical protein [Desulfobacula toluolica]CCK80293.1 conserved uncharacterized protein [Desulfobacula toluolica Tol2]